MFYKSINGSFFCKYDKFFTFYVKYAIMGMFQNCYISKYFGNMERQ